MLIICIEFKTLINKRQCEIAELKNAIRKLTVYYRKESSDIKDLSIRWDSEQSKLYDWVQKKSSISRKHSILELEAEKGSMKVSKLINEINSLHNLNKSPSKLTSAQIKAKNEYKGNLLFDNKIDGCQNLHTQDSERKRIR